MAGICPVCGEKVGGFTGKAEPFQRLLDEAQALGVYKLGTCLDCLKSIVEKTKQEHPEKAAIYQAVPPSKTISSVSFAIITSSATEKIFLSPSPVPVTGEDRGLVTGYCILGTGPFTALFSSVTDTFGIKSNAYLEKARTAEKEALSMMKLEALKLGADAVYCVRINLTEATSGNGMLMVSAAGAAVKTPAPAPEIVKAIEILDGSK